MTYRPVCSNMSRRWVGLEVDRQSIVRGLGIVLDNNPPRMATNLDDKLIHDKEHILPRAVPARTEECKREYRYLGAQSADNVNSLAARPPDRCQFVGDCFAHIRTPRRQGHRTAIDEGRMRLVSKTPGEQGKAKSKLERFTTLYGRRFGKDI